MQRTRQILRNTRGVGLIEVLVSMVLLSVGVLGMGLMIGASIQGNVTSHDNTVVTTLIKNQIESIESLDSIPMVPFKTAESGLEGIYSRTTYVVDNTVDTLIPAGLYLVEVEVAWEGQDQLRHSQRYSTYLAKP